MNLKDVVRDAAGNSWKKAGLRVFLIAIGSLLPFLLGWIFLNLFRVRTDYFSFISHGEAGIATIGVVLSGSVLIAKELAPPFAHRLLFLFIAICLTVISALVYCSAAVSLRVPQMKVDNAFFAATSLGIWFLALFFGGFIELIDAVREQKVDPGKEREAQLKDLKTAFEESANDQN